MGGVYGDMDWTDGGCLKGAWESIDNVNRRTESVRWVARERSERDVGTCQQQQKNISIFNMSTGLAVVAVNTRT